MGLRLRLRELCVAGAWSRPLETCSTDSGHNSANRKQRALLLYWRNRVF
jgi:hypothetical protein